MSALEKLSDRCGIGRDYLDFKKDPVQIAPAARMAVLAAMGYTATEESASEALSKLAAASARPLPKTLLLRHGDPIELELDLPEQAGGWELRALCERGEKFDLDAGDLDGAVSVDNPCPEGYHRLQLLDSDGAVACECAMLVAPRTSYQPDKLEAGGSVFGVSVQLYTVRSARNWGMGDFTDLERLIRDSASAGVDVVGLNPLHALFPANPLHFSPYSPSNRSFLNVMYIDPERVPGYADCAPAREQVESEAFQGRLAALRDTHHVDYQGVADCKLPVLELLYRRFIDHAAPRDREAFERFCEARGDALQLHAIYDTLHEYYLRQDMQIWGWPVWPEQYRDPASPAVAEFAAEHADRVRYYQFLQWCANEQLATAQAVARECGMAVGIYLDLAVGVDMNGSEVWANQSAFCLEASAGAPPDELARSGQDWGFPPLDPTELRDSAYRLFVDNLRANMSVCGAVRYDHAVSLLRLWWIPKSGSAADGAYVNYSLEELLGILALESQRNRCLVIGEDLGTVPEELTQVMEENHLFSYRVLYFEKSKSGMIAPADYPREAVATVTTHDLPPLASWWDGSDIELRADLDLLGSEATVAEMRSNRVLDRQRLLDALIADGCWDGEGDAAAIPAMTDALNVAVHRFLAHSRSAVMIAQLEDLMGMVSPVNVPGTFDTHKNWQRKLRWPLENLFQRESVAELCTAMREART